MKAPPSITETGPSDIGRWTNHLFNLVYSFVLSAAVLIALLANIIVESFNPARLGLILALLLGLHLLRYPKLLSCREISLYAAFAGYMFVSLLWTNDLVLATNSLLPTLDCVLVLLLVGGLATYHNLCAVLAGMLVGFLTCAALYDVTQGFPFVRPDGFPYNAIAGMFVFGLFIALMFGWATRMRVLPLALGLVIMVHIAATTSIKTNLGVLLGAAAASVIFFRHFVMLIRQNAVALVIIASLILYKVVSNPVFIQTVQGGLDRVGAGVTILVAREDQTGTTEFGARKTWGISLEGKTMWLLRSSPLAMRELLWSKFWVGTIPLLVMALALVMVTGMLMHVTEFIMLVSIFTITMMTFAIAGLAIGFGTMYPRFETENAAQIPTSFGGLLFMMASIVMIAAVIILEARPVFGYLGSRAFGAESSTTEMVIGFGLAGLLCCAATLIPIRVALKRLEALEA